MQENQHPTYWQSLEEYFNDPKVAENKSKEFIAPPEAPSDLEGYRRRDFMKMLGAASAALAGAGCVRRPVQKLVPYVNRPEELTLGVALKYASSAVFNGTGNGLVVRTHEGRPVHVESHPEHPLGHAGFMAQSQIMNLYDPERLQKPVRNLHNKKRTNRETVAINLEELDPKFASNLKNGYTVILTSSLGSPSSEQTFKDFFSAFPGRVVHWDSFSYDGVKKAQKDCYGSEGIVPRLRLKKSKFTVAIGTDFLGTWGNTTEFARDFAESRRDPSHMSKLVVFESNMSVTGMNADERYRIKPSQTADIAGYMVYHLLVKHGRTKYASQEDVKNQFKQFASVPQELGIKTEALDEVIEGLWENRGQSLVIGGGMETESESSDSHNIAVNFLNHILENDGKTIDAEISPNVGYVGSTEDLLQLIKDMNSGQVKNLIIHRSNPVYNLPDSTGFSEALKKVPLVIYTGDRNDETGQMADYILPENHRMESWGDTEVQQGVFSLQQPTLRELYNTRSLEFALGVWAAELEVGPDLLQEVESYYDYVKATWEKAVFPKSGMSNFDEFWQMALKDGIVDTVKEKRNQDHSPRSFKLDSLKMVKKRQVRGNEYEVLVYQKPHILDGQHSNVGWLQELPDPVTKITWDNYLNISLGTAEREKLKEADMVELELPTGKMTVRVHIQPGMADGVVSLAMGYGRWGAGKVGDKVGVNATPAIQLKEGRLIFGGTAAKFKKVKSSKYYFANTQGHNSMEGRAIAIEASAKDYKKKHSAGIHKHKIWSLWEDFKYDKYKWALSVDLNTCNGCSLCVTACQSENNIPVVGRKYILQGREMSWMRLDRYYKGDPNNPTVVNQPVMCQHCDKAPCESVCPVLATVHDDEGLNTMVYNRCVGTRYCANNCPYKVRRFNWFYYGDQFEKPRNMQLNPNVTVRTRGVMEKCSFCVQRIKEAKDVARNENRMLKDGEVVTACEAACPTKALVFGNMIDPGSRVSQHFKEDRTYAMLEEWHVKPSVRYKTKIRNVNYTIAHDHHYGGDKKGHGKDSHGMKETSTHGHGGHNDGHGHDSHGKGDGH